MDAQLLQDEIAIITASLDRIERMMPHPANGDAANAVTMAHLVVEKVAGHSRMTTEQYRQFLGGLIADFECLLREASDVGAQ